MKRWIIVGLAASATMFGCPPMLIAAAQADPSPDDWVLEVERYANRHACPDAAARADERSSRPAGRRSRRR